MAKLHFSIDGEGLTEIARNMLLSEKPDAAWQLLTECLSYDEPGMTEHAAKLVLDGKMKFVGVNKLSLVDDPDAKEYLSNLQYIFAGRVRVEGRWWRPKVRVTNFGPDDVPEGRSIPAGVGSEARARKAAFGRARVQFYAGPEERVLLDDVIFEPCGEPPHWWKRNLNPAAALKDFLAAGRTLDEDGWFQRFGDPDEEPPPAGFVKLSEEEEADRRQEEREAAFKRHLEDVKVRVQEQAAGDLYDLKLGDGKVVQVPRAPFFHWCLWRTSLAHLAPPWKCVATGGEKMPGDDPYHTDWVLGAGLALEAAYNGPIKDASWEARFVLQSTLGNFEATVVTGGDDVTGRVGKDILVLPDLNPEHLEKMLGMRAVITERGGRLAHLAVVAMEKSIPIMLVPDALKRFPEGTKVTLRISEGKIEIPDTYLR